MGINEGVNGLGISFFPGNRGDGDVRYEWYSIEIFCLLHSLTWSSER